MLLFMAITAENQKSRTRKSDKGLDALLVHIADSDKEALSVLYHQTKSAVYGFALSILRNQPDAEDVMQDVYVKIYTSAKSYRSEGKPMAWILTIVRNQSLMLLREGKKTEPLSDERKDLADPHDFTGERNDRIMLEGALTILTDEERQIVLLYSVVGYKHREIAEFMNLPLSTVLSKYQRSQKKKKKHLKEDDLHG